MWETIAIKACIVYYSFLCPLVDLFFDFSEKGRAQMNKYGVWTTTIKRKFGLFAFMYLLGVVFWTASGNLFRYYRNTIIEEAEWDESTRLLYKVPAESNICATVNNTWPDSSLFIEARLPAGFLDFSLKTGDTTIANMPNATRFVLRGYNPPYGEIIECCVTNDKSGKDLSRENEHPNRAVDSLGPCRLDHCGLSSARSGGLQTEMNISDLPYGASYASAGSKSRCPVCKKSLEPDSLSLSQRVHSLKFDGLEERFFHFHCFWREPRPGINEALIHGFTFLNWEHQEMLRNRFDKQDECGITSKSLRPSGNPRISQTIRDRFKCFDCGEGIAKATVKLSYKSYHHHLECFFKRGHFNLNSLEQITGYDAVDRQSKSILQKLFAECKKAKQVEKRKREKEARATKCDPALTEALRSQTQRLCKALEVLRDVPEDVYYTLLQYNEATSNQAKPQENMKQLADHMVFGVPNLCEECFGKFRFNESLHCYSCSGNKSGYTRCTQTSKNPSRRPFTVLDFYLDAFPALMDYHECEPSDRVYPPIVDRVPANCITVTERERKNFENTSTLRVFQTVMKNGCMVDSSCSLAPRTHVVVDNEGAWQALLTLVDTAANKNSYHVVQLLESDVPGGKFFMYTVWGRVGTTIGDNKIRYFYRDVASAKAKFIKLFAEKTGNAWAMRKRFIKHAGLYDYVEMDCDEAALSLPPRLDPTMSKSLLPMPIKALISAFFDTARMLHALCDMKVDTRQMPVGKLSRAQLLKAFSVLKRIEILIESGYSDPTEFIDHSNEFYHLLPHNVGLNVLPVIDSVAALKAKVHMITDLLDMQEACSVMRRLNHDMSTDLLDRCYEALNCKLSLLSPCTTESRVITKYATATHGSTHNFSVSVKQIFEVKRAGESETFRKNLGNHALLWHGSRVTNFAGILSQGLRIAPPEAPATGYMFGRGIYFADMITKSAQYCHNRLGHGQKEDGYLLLCQVALGQCEVVSGPYGFTAPDPGFDSVQGIGQCRPNIFETQYLDGVRVPCGAPTDTPCSELDAALCKTPIIYSHLRYNEYVVYDASQVLIRYLVHVQISHR